MRAEQVRRFTDFVGITRPAGTQLLPWFVTLALGIVGLGWAVFSVAVGGPRWATALMLVLGALLTILGARARRPRRADTE